MSEDQNQGQGETESQEKGEQNSQQDNQGNQDQGKSNEGQSKEGEAGSKQEKLYKTPDGRELNADQIYGEYGKLYPEFTRRSQKLRDYERKEREMVEQAQVQARQNADEKLKNVPPDVKEAIIGIVTPYIQEALTKNEQAEAQRKRDEAFEQELSALSKEFPGGDGKPKFDRNELIDAMRNPDNRNFDPRSKFWELKKKEFIDWEVRRALKGKSSGIITERTGLTQDRKPEGKTPKTFNEARKAALSRLR